VKAQRLAAMLLDHIAQLRATGEPRPTPLVPQLVDQQRQRFMARWQEAVALRRERRAAQKPRRTEHLIEATAFAIRIDVAEGSPAYNSHLDELQQTDRQRVERCGKRLDFLIQELHREANTLGAKSAALELTRISVDMKVLIEQMREQVQNVGSGASTDTQLPRALPHGLPRKPVCRCSPERGRQIQPGEGTAGARLARSTLGLAHHAPPDRENAGASISSCPNPNLTPWSQADAFVEWAHVHGHRYGTSKKRHRRAHGQGGRCGAGN
jgi:hypothetical protein